MCRVLYCYNQIWHVKFNQFGVPLLSSKTRILVLRALSILGCLVFLFSIIFPFLFARYPNSVIEEDMNMTDFWSFKSYTQQGNPFMRWLSKIYEYWFVDYWIKASAYRSEFLALLPLMFAAQILTLVTVVVSVFVRKRFLTSVTVVLCSMVVALMTYVGMSSKVNWHWHFQEGYWLTILSLFVFILSYALRKRFDERNITGIYTPTHAQTQ